MHICWARLRSLGDQEKFHCGQMWTKSIPKVLKVKKPCSVNKTKSHIWKSRYFPLRDPAAPSKNGVESILLVNCKQKVSLSRGKFKNLYLLLLVVFKLLLELRINKFLYLILVWTIKWQAIQWLIIIYEGNFIWNKAWSIK